MKKILITPRVSYSKKRGYFYWIEKSWYDYSKKININLQIYNYKFSKKIFAKNKIDCVIFSGGNDLFKFKKSKENHFRDKYETILLKYCIKKNIPILCVCRGFQLISSYFKNNIVSLKGHVKKQHSIFLEKNKFTKKRKLIVNSFHNYGIKELKKNFVIIAKHKDNSIEIASIKNKKVLCFMFHPERYSKAQKEVNKIIKNFFIK